MYSVTILITTGTLMGELQHIDVLGDDQLIEMYGLQEGGTFRLLNYEPIETYVTELEAPVD